MASQLIDPPKIRTLADLLERLGGISPGRVLYDPSPGKATEADLIDIQKKENRLCELVDGVLVEKAMGYRESCLALALAAFLRSFVVPRNLGLVSGADGTIRLFPGLVRIPDVAFISWARLPNRKMPTVPIPHLAPDLAVEVMSESNTEKEMARKLQEYFNCSVSLVWLVEPDARTVAVHTSPEAYTLLNEAQTLHGDPVLPGFQLPLPDLFAELDRHGKE
ncbi:MAG TPA: Uma2 family endonuclease [Gemmataceae bacterium]|nr:Uma2 family endonuclease [Gemmataceae bacterium]